MTDPDKVIKVLIVDDDLGFCTSLADLLSAMGYEVMAETDSRNVLATLREVEIDAALIDLVMPHLSGLDLIRLIRQARFNLPIIIISANGTASDTATAIRCGASDFLTKPIDVPFLRLRLEQACEIERARRLANTDALTGLFNRRYLQEHLDQEVDRAQRYERPLSFVMADVDHFKPINDNYGHPRGDEVLIAVSHELRRLARRVDVLARFGGEEFAMLLPETPLLDAVRLAERARLAVEAPGLRDEIFAAEENVSLSMSFGVAAYSSGCAGADLVLAADEALYQAKRTGRNRVCCGAVDERERGSVGRPAIGHEVPGTLMGR